VSKSAKVVLVRILPGWHSEEVAVHLVFATNRGIVPAVRVLIDYLAEHFKIGGDQGFKRKKIEATRPAYQKNGPIKAT
jgi:hypothetical protein